MHTLKLLPHERAKLERQGLIRPLTSREIDERLATATKGTPVEQVHPRSSVQLLAWRRLGRCPIDKYVTLSEVVATYGISSLAIACNVLTRDHGLRPVGMGIYLASEVSEALKDYIPGKPRKSRKQKEVAK